MADTRPPDLRAIIEPYAYEIFVAFTSQRAAAMAELWREIIEANPKVEILRKIAFEMSTPEAKAIIVELYPIAAVLPGLSKLIADFQFEMRRQRPTQ